MSRVFSTMPFTLGSFNRFVRSVSTNRSVRSEEHTSELQSQSNLVCRLLLEKKKTVRPDDGKQGRSRYHNTTAATDSATSTPALPLIALDLIRGLISTLV